MQVLETIVGITVINAAVSKAGPLDDDVFKLDIRYKQDSLQHTSNKQAGLHLLSDTKLLARCCITQQCLVLNSTSHYLILVKSTWVLQEAFQQARWVAVLGLAGLPGCTCCGQRLCLLGLCCGL